MSAAGARVFVSYSHADKRWLDALEKQLAPLEGDLDLWVDKDIAPGQRWRDEIEKALRTARVALLLVSADFLGSLFIREHELPALLEAAEAGGLRVLVVHVGPSALAHDAPLSPVYASLKQFQHLNEAARPLSAFSGHHRKRVLAEVAVRIIAATQDASADCLESDARAYVERLRESTRRLKLGGLGNSRADHVDLEQVFTRLHVAAPEVDEREVLRKGGRGAIEPRDRELRDLLGVHPCLALVGDPGSGKTTFLQFVALNLARAWLDDERAKCLEHLGLSGAPPFPILVRLADFARFLETPEAGALPTDCAELFYRFLDQPAPGVPSDLPPVFRRRRLCSGGCLLLLDGLDEVSGEDIRARVSAVIADVVAEGRRAPGNRYVVTCRTRAYEGRTRLGPVFTRAMLLDFGEPEVETFVAQWSRALFEADAGGSSEAAEEHRRDLLGAIRAHPHVRPLTRNPLLLTILAVVHWNRKKLPEQRADLYEAAVASLLDSRPREDLDSADRLLLLQAIALRAFTDPGGVRRSLGRREAMEAVDGVLDRGLPAADAFLRDEEERSGLLVGRREGELEFSHLTFGEYLAARDLAWRRDRGWELLRPRVFDPAWSEVVLLLAGHMWSLGPNLVQELIRDILGLGHGLADRARQIGLIGRILRDVRPRAQGRDPSAKTGYAEALHQVLAAFDVSSDVPEHVRVEVGEALGQVGDPRFIEDEQASRVWIEGGTFEMGADDLDPGDRPVHRVTISGIWMDRTPVVVESYQRFVRDGGYGEQRHWSAVGWAVKEERSWTSPRGWEEQQRHLNRPVTFVTWYEAEAYCAWLSAASGQRVRLPTEAEWEFAARGERGRKYPWGDDEPTARHMNFDGRVGRPTPVGIYPLGGTPEGVQDLAGNVWEWCMDWYGPYAMQAQRNPVGPSTGEARVLRGGAFINRARSCRSAYRSNPHPETDGGNVGFRCVVLEGGKE